MDRIYVQTNDAERNEVVAFDRAADGKLAARALRHRRARYRQPHLASQSSVVVSGDRLLVTNAGSDDSRSSASRRRAQLTARPDRRQPPDERRGSRRARIRR